MNREEEGIRLHPRSSAPSPLRGLAIRFAFGAVISVIAGLVGNRGGPWRAGCSSRSPPSWRPRWTLIEDKEQRSKPAAQDAKGAVLGAAGLIGFAGCVWGLAVTLPAWLALVIAVAVWAVMADVLYLMFGRQA